MHPPSRFPYLTTLFPRKGKTRERKRGAKEDAKRGRARDRRVRTGRFPNQVERNARFNSKRTGPLSARNLRRKINWGKRTTRGTTSAGSANVVRVETVFPLFWGKKNKAACPCTSAGRRTRLSGVCSFPLLSCAAVLFVSPDWALSNPSRTWKTRTSQECITPWKGKSWTEPELP